MKIELCGGMNVITDMTSKEKTRIKNDLTLDNPVYKQIKKYSRCQFTSVPPNLFLFKTIGKALLVPRGYSIPFGADSLKDSRVDIKVNYPRLKIQLRETQEVAYREWIKDTDRGVTILPTGKGKSIYGAYLAYSKRQRTLIIVQKNDLVDGWKKDILTMFPSLRPKKIGLIKAGVFRIGEQYTITTIQTLSKLPADKLASLYDQFGMIIQDEFHHVPASSYDVLKYFKSKYFIGLTATAMRDDGLEKVLYWMFGDICYRHAETTYDEDIMPYKVVLKQSSIHYDPPNEFDKGGRRIPTSSAELKKVIASSKTFNHLVASDIKKEYDRNKSCIAFFHEKEHIHTMRDILEQIGVNSEHIQLYYGDSKVKDSEMKRKAETKEVLITLATFAKATEGTNVKSWERAFLVTSLNNIKNVIQAVGRVRRRKDGKKDVVVYDYSHPHMKSVRNHLSTRLKAYEQTKAKVIGSHSPKRTVTRGWKSIRKS